MGILGKLKMMSAKPETDIEEYLDTLGLEEGDLLEEHADMWVKSYRLEDVADVERVNGELLKGNMVILDIEPLYKKNTIKLRQSISEIKGAVHSMNGDIARLTEQKILITPANIKFSKK